MDDLKLEWMVIRLKMDDKKDDFGRSFEPKWTVLGQSGQSWVKLDGQSSKMDVQFNPRGSSTLPEDHPIRSQTVYLRLDLD